MSWYKCTNPRRQAGGITGASSLVRRLGRPLGLLEPLQIYSKYLEPSARRSLWARLQALDPAGWGSGDGAGIDTDVVMKSPDT